MASYRAFCLLDMNSTGRFCFKLVRRFFLRLGLRLEGMEGGREAE